MYMDPSLPLLQLEVSSKISSSRRRQQEQKYGQGDVAVGGRTLFGDCGWICGSWVDGFQDLELREVTARLLLPPESLPARAGRK